MADCLIPATLCSFERPLTAITPPATYSTASPGAIKAVPKARYDFAISRIRSELLMFSPALPQPTTSEPSMFAKKQQAIKTPISFALAYSFYKIVQLKSNGCSRQIADCSYETPHAFQSIS